jgi:hypothetical protein
VPIDLFGRLDRNHRLAVRFMQLADGAFGLDLGSLNLRSEVRLLQASCPCEVPRRTVLGGGIEGAREIGIP